MGVINALDQWVVDLVDYLIIQYPTPLLTVQFVNFIMTVQFLNSLLCYFL